MESLDRVPQLKRSNDAVNSMMKLATHASLEADGSDGAYGNKRYQAYREQLINNNLNGDLSPATSDILFAQANCGNHDVAITDTVIHGMLGHNHIKRLRSFISLLKGCGFFSEG